MMKCNGLKWNKVNATPLGTVTCLFDLITRTTYSSAFNNNNNNKTPSGCILELILFYISHSDAVDHSDCATCSKKPRQKE